MQYYVKITAEVSQVLAHVKYLSSGSSLHWKCMQYLVLIHNIVIFMTLHGKLELVFRMLVCLLFMHLQYNVYNIVVHIYNIYTHMIQNNLRTLQLGYFYTTFHL